MNSSLKVCSFIFKQHQFIIHRIMLIMINQYGVIQRSSNECIKKTGGMKLSLFLLTRRVQYMQRQTISFGFLICL